MIFTKKAYIDAPQCNIYLNGKNLKQVKHLKYLGCSLSWNCREDKEMNIRLGQAKSAFRKMKSIICSKNLSFKSRFRVLNCYIYPIFTYCSETWSISKAMESRIQAFEMWCFRRMQRISWKAKMSNEHVLRQIGQHANLLKAIKIRQMRFLGHVIRKEKLEHLSLTGLIPGKRARGVQRQTYVHQFGKSPTTLIQDAYDRKAWKKFTPEAINVWTRQDTR